MHSCETSGPTGRYDRAMRPHVGPRGMLKALIPASLLVLLVVTVGQASAAPAGDPSPSASSPNNDAQADWHGGHRGGGRSHGGDGGNGGGDDSSGGVIIGFPSPSGPQPPSPCPISRYPTPCSIPGPALPAQREAAQQPRPWPVWYYCDQPNGYYPYVRVCDRDWKRLPVLPPPPGSGAPIAEGSWQLCDDPAGYFPYVAQCRLPWTRVAATIPVPGDYPDGIAEIGQWYYCEDAKGYLPYVGSCPHVWRIIPAMPPPNIQSTEQSKTAANPH